jgi:hypothetical protein
MGEDMKPETVLDDLKVHVKTKISLLWISATLCYLYGDVIGFYKPGAIRSMLDGRMGFWGPLPATQGLLLFIATVMAVPSVMVFLTLALSPTVSRWLNVIVGLIYTAIVLITMPSALDLYFYEFLSVVEVLLTGLIVWYALTWPRHQVQE